MKNLTKTTLISLATLTVFSIGAWATCDADVDMGGHKISNVANPIDKQDVVTLSYLENYINIDDSTLTLKLIRNNNTFIVTDYTTGLEWQDNFHVVDSDGKMGQADAIKYCSRLELDGGNWRLPSMDELLSIIKEDTVDPAISSIFQHTKSTNYWSTRLLVSFYSGTTIIVLSPDTKLNFVRCVRYKQ